MTLKRRPVTDADLAKASDAAKAAEEAFFDLVERYREDGLERGVQIDRLASVRQRLMLLTREASMLAISLDTVETRWRGTGRVEQQ
jgi:hypothetical protein